jgi:hypothetical protein
MRKTNGNGVRHYSTHNAAEFAEFLKMITRYGGTVVFQSSGARYLASERADK